MRSNPIGGSLCLISLMAMVACAPSQPHDVSASRSDQPALDMQQASQPAPEPMPLAATDAPQPKKPAARPVKAAAAPKPVAANTTAQPADPASATTEAPVLEARPVAESREARAAAPRQDEEESIATTIGGCLVHDDGMFKLKDTDGEHAPKSRSWKSGFIKKSSSRVELVDATHRLNLSSHVGYRVSVSGTLAEREMHVRSIKGGTERCD